MRARGDARACVIIQSVTSPTDKRIAELSALLNATFPDPNTVLGLDRIQEFLAANGENAARRFCVEVAEDEGRVIGGTIFSYVVRSNCGFSEYIVTHPGVRGRGLGRTLFDHRKAVLDGEAATRGQSACSGLFIEADNPRRTPAHFVEAERETALDTVERLRLFDHLGFRRVDLPYVQPPLASGKQAIDYMDLLFAAWQPPSLLQIPADWVFDTLEPVWSAWTPDTFVTHLTKLRRDVRTSHVRLVEACAPRG
jgi:GNAT superfamily N-acetyltransferase